MLAPVDALKQSEEFVASVKSKMLTSGFGGDLCAAASEFMGRVRACIPHQGSKVQYTIDRVEFAVPPGTLERFSSVSSVNAVTVAMNVGVLDDLTAFVNRMLGIWADGSGSNGRLLDARFKLADGENVFFVAILAENDIPVISREVRQFRTFVEPRARCQRVGEEYEHMVRDVMRFVTTNRATPRPEETGSVMHLAQTLNSWQAGQINFGIRCADADGAGSAAGAGAGEGDDMSQYQMRYELKVSPLYELAIHDIMYLKHECIEGEHIPPSFVPRNKLPPLLSAKKVGAMPLFFSVGSTNECAADLGASSGDDKGSQSGPSDGVANVPISELAFVPRVQHFFQLVVPLVISTAPPGCRLANPASSSSFSSSTKVATTAPPPTGEAPPATKKRRLSSIIGGMIPGMFRPKDPTQWSGATDVAQSDTGADPDAERYEPLSKRRCVSESY